MDHDPQVASVRSILQTLGENATIIEYGAGQGRLLGAFKAVLDERPKTWTYIAIDVDASNAQPVTEYYKELKLEFRGFKFEIKPSNDDFADLTLVANVLHEVGPEKIPELLSGALRQAKAGSAILILEALELAVGEKHFVVFNGEALKEMFRRCEETGAVTLRVAQPRSFGGTPLLEAFLKVNDPTHAVVDKNDVMRALDAVINAEGVALANIIQSDRRSNPRALAFRSHNLANAVGFKKVLEGKVPTNGNPR
jgi:hypothetical protein